MTTANINISNLKHHQFDDNHTLLFGEISSIVKKAESINIPGNIKSNSHIVLAKSDSDYLFKSSMSNSPVISDYDVTLYDHSATAIAKYPKGRTNNDHGNTKSMLSSVKFISEVKLPNVSEDEIVYLIIDNYGALEDVLLEDSVEKLVQTDFLNFVSNNSYLEKEQKYLFIKEDVYERIKNYIELDNIFETVVPIKNTIDALIEYLMGKNISCSRIAHQTNLNISEDVDILSTTISPSLRPNCKLIGRSNHTLQLNLYQDKTRFNFVTLLKHNLRLEKLSITNIGEVSSITQSTEMFQSEIDDYKIWKQLRENTIFHIELEKKISQGESLEFILQNSQKVIEYLFNPKLKEILEVKNVDELVEHSNNSIVKSIIQLLNSERKKIKNRSAFSPELPSPQNYNDAILGRQHSIARVNFPEEFY